MLGKICLVRDNRKNGSVGLRSLGSGNKPPESKVTAVSADMERL